MASRGPNRVSEPALWLPICEVIVTLLARSARPDVPLRATQAHQSPDRIVSPASSAQVKALVDDFADPLRRWVVERTLAWISKYRRCVRDYETLPEHAEAMSFPH